MIACRLTGVHVAFRTGSHARAKDQAIRVLDDIDLEVRAGEVVALIGPSGSGKSTLLHTIAGLRRPDAGRVEMAGHDMTSCSAAAAAAVRSLHVGMVFQSFHLLGHATARENVALAALVAGTPRREALRRADAVLERLGLSARAEHHPARLSGGEQQRVAIARALVNDPSVVLADEPTGNLDASASRAVTRLLVEQATEGRAVVVATHDGDVGSVADRVVRLGRPSASGPE